MVKPLTKSRFKIALECPTRLYYEANDQYRNRLQDDAFLAALADGGHQVGALAKFKYHPDPQGQAITVEETKYDEAVTATDRLLAAPGRVVIAEAALRHGTCFVRVDLLIRDPQRQCIEIIEVKSKGVSQEDIDTRFKGGDWQPYLYDVAFQAEIARRVFPGWQIIPKLLLLDKDVACDIEGLHQKFRVIVDEGGRNPHIEIPPGLRREDLGSLDLLREVDVSDIVRDLLASPVRAPHTPPEHAVSMLAFIDWAARLQQSGARHFGGVSKACKDCPYRAQADDAKRSGVHECFEQAIGERWLDGPPGPLPRDLPLSIDLWGGAAGNISIAGRVLESGRALLSSIQEADLPAGHADPDDGLTPLQRRLAQVRAAREPDYRGEISEERLSDMDRWEWPLHMIDFETASPALPFFKGSRPHDMLAFQFSHHVMDRDNSGQVTIRHASQWISTEAGAFPSFDFVRQLRQALMPDGQLHGTVFRYHNHENTVLRKLHQAIGDHDLPDGPQLQAFIDLITTRHTGNGRPKIAGARPMVDLHRLVQQGYYSAHAGGSISLKYILPAILHDAPGVRHVYARPGIYGRGLPIESLNFEGAQGQVWLPPESAGNPYRSLPPVFGEGFNELDARLLRLGGDGDEEGSIAHGGAAMVAYSHTQFASLPPAHRQRIRQALLRYCELDTLAMVMLVQGLMELRGRPLALRGITA